ncbi:MAG TPA: low affinity iron permease family protein [Nitrospira sp.]|nr:low affinity iron permease family protein [Nitrospira sp.]
MINAHDKHGSGPAAQFARFAKHCATAMGHPWAFGTALLVIIGWAVTGPAFGYSDTWQLVINTGTTIVTFLMVFLIQNTQNRDSSATQLKLDELIRATRGAHNALLDLEELTQDELNAFLQTYQELAQQGRTRVRQGWKDTDTPDVSSGKDVSP